MNNISGIILAAGKGARLNMTHTNKVLLKLKGKALIEYPVDLLNKLQINFYVVVGYKKEEIKKKLGDNIAYVEQKGPSGTGGAVLSVLPYLFPETTDILVMFGDHSFFYSLELIKKMLLVHQKNRASVTALVVKTKFPSGYGRVIRDHDGTIIKITEEKNLTPEQKKITEVATGLYCFAVEFLRKYKNKLRRHSTTGEYYLTDFVEIARNADKTVSEVNSKEEKLAWGVNTMSDLERIKEIMV